MKKRLNLYIHVAVIIFCFANLSLAQTKVYVIGVENIDYFPHFTYENGKFGGHGRAILDAFAKSQGYTFVYEAFPIKRLYKNLLDKKLDFKYPDNPNWKQKLKQGTQVHYSHSVAEYIDGVVVLPERKGQGVKQLKTLGTVLGFTAWDYLDLINSKVVELDENPNFRSLLRKVFLKRVDGGYANIAVVRYQLEKMGKDPLALVFDPNLPHTRDSYRVSTIKHPKLIEEFDLFLNKERHLVEQLKQSFKLETEIK